MLHCIHCTLIEPLDAMKMTEVTNNPSGTNAAGGELIASTGIVAGIAVSVSVVLVLAMITTIVIIVMAISYFRRMKKKDKTGNHLHHTPPIYDTIPDIPEPSNDTTTAQEAVLRRTTVMERHDRNNVMQSPSNCHPLGSTRLEGHNNVVVLYGNHRSRESIQTRENEAYMYAVADQCVHVPVQETNPKDYVNVYPSKNEAENYIYPVSNRWMHIKQQD